MDSPKIGLTSEGVMFHDFNTFWYGVFLTGEKIVVHALQHPAIAAVNNTTLVGLLLVDEHFRKGHNHIAQYGIVHSVASVEVDDVRIVLTLELFLAIDSSVLFAEESPAQATALVSESVIQMLLHFHEVLDGFFRAGKNRLT
jgi:hypothetical protein